MTFDKIYYLYIVFKYSYFVLAYARINLDISARPVPLK